jgi:hypothetical protein
MVCKQELKTELEKSLAAGAMTDRFAVIAEEIVTGYFSQRSMKGFSAGVREEFMGFFRMRLVRYWKKLDPSRNPHSAITQQGRWAVLDSERKFKQRKRLMERMHENGSFDEALGETAL